MNIVEINENYEPSAVNVGLNEAVYIKIPNNKTFIEGFEIEIKIPKIVASYRDSVIYSFFNNVNPEAKSTIIDYSGEKIFQDVIPPRFSVNFQVFLDSILNPKTSPYSTLLPFSISANQNALVLKFQLAMKGVPEEFFNSEFTVNIKPILKNEGALNINIISPQENISNLSVYIDENIVEDFSKPILLKTGMHHLSVISQDFRNEVRTFVINQAQITTLDIELKSIEPELMIIAPSETLVFLDDIEILDYSEAIKIQAGEHTIKFNIGNYELTKKLFIQNGKSYEVSLSVDIKIDESISN